MIQGRRGRYIKAGMRCLRQNIIIQIKYAVDSVKFYIFSHTVIQPPRHASPELLAYTFLSNSRSRQITFSGAKNVFFTIRVDFVTAWFVDTPNTVRQEKNCSTFTSLSP